MRVWWLVAFLFVWVPEASARDGIVLESYEGPRPPNADKLLEPLLQELAQYGFEAGNNLGLLWEGQVSQPSREDLPASFAKQLLDGQQEYIRGNYAAAVEKLQPLIDAAHASSAAFAKNQALRQTMLDALIALALALDRNGDPKGSRATFEELARSFPVATVPAKTWGPAAAKQFDAVQKDLAAQARGQLIVKASAGAEIYINEALEPQNGTVVKVLAPGEYRVFARDGVKQSRTYRVKVRSVVDASVTIDLDLDDALHTTRWTGLAYRSASDRQRFEAKHAAAFAQRLQEGGVVVVGIDGSGVIFAALVDLSGKDKLRGIVEASGGASRLRQLAAFIAGQPATEGIKVITGPGAPGNTKVIDDAPPHARGTKTRWGGWPIITGLATLGAAGAAVYFLAEDGSCADGSNDPRCADLKERSPHAYVSFGAGAVLAGLTIYLIVTRSSSSSDRTAYIVPTSDGAMAGMSLRF